MDKRRVSVAEGKKSLTQLLRQARERRVPILIYNERLNEMAGAILSPEDYRRYERLRGYFEALRLSDKYAGRKLNLPKLLRKSREQLEAR